MYKEKIVDEMKGTYVERMDEDCLPKKAYMCIKRMEEEDRKTLFEVA